MISRRAIIFAIWLVVRWIGWRDCKRSRLSGEVVRHMGVGLGIIYVAGFNVITLKHSLNVKNIRF